MNKVTMGLKKRLGKSSKNTNDETSWRLKGFTCDSEEAIFGAGKLSLSIGTLATGHKVCMLLIYG